MIKVEGLVPEFIQEQLRELGLWSLEAQGRIYHSNYLTGGCSRACQTQVYFFSQVASYRVGENSLRLHQGPFRFDIREKIPHQKACQALEKGSQRSYGVTIP